MTGVTDVSADALSRLLDLTPRRLSQLAADGVLQRTGRGMYALVASVQAYVRYLSRGQSDVQDSLRSARERLLVAQANRAELEVEEENGLLIKADDVEEHWAAMTVNMRARLLAIPTRLMPFVDPDNATAVQEQLRDIVHAVLSDMASSDVVRCQKFVDSKSALTENLSQNSEES